MVGEIMEANPKKLLDEFIPEATGKQFVIPVYQRKYTWTVNKQIKQFVNDLNGLIENENKEHFLGTIIYLETRIKAGYETKTERSIVDGQQRLVTMFLTVAALETFTSNEYQEREIREQYLENYGVPKESKYRQRLYPAVSDEGDYELVVNKEFDKLRTSNSNVAKNFLYLKEKLAALIEKYSFDQVKYALKRFTIVYIKLDEHDDAQQIFESINSNGERLTASDLMRNFIMMDKSNAEQTRLYKKYWKELEDIFDDSRKMEDFFRFYLAAVTNDLVEKKKLYFSFKEYYLLKRKIVSDDELLSEIVRYAHYFSKLYYDDLENSREELVDYRNIASLMPAPFMLAFYNLYDHDKKITEDQFYGVMRIMNIYLIRRSFAGFDTSKVSRAFPVYLKRVKEIAEENGYENIEDIVIYVLVNKNRSTNMVLPTDKNLESNMMEANAYRMGMTRWLLEKIENQENSAKLDMKGLSIEHIMPQTSTDYWLGKAGVSDEEYAELVNTIGNLTLVTKVDNSAAGNRDFATKKHVFNDTLHIHMNQELFQKKDWTANDIYERSKKIIAELIKMYPYLRSHKDYDYKENRKIYIEMSGIHVDGYLNDNNQVTVYAGAQLSNDSKLNDRNIELRKQLLDQGILKNNDGKLVLIQDYTASPSSTAELILGGSKNGWDYWKDSNGISINESLR